MGNSRNITPWERLKNPSRGRKITCRFQVPCKLLCKDPLKDFELKLAPLREEFCYNAQAANQKFHPVGEVLKIFPLKKGKKITPWNIFITLLK